MISHIVELVVPSATAEQFYDFMIAPSDKRYSEWWPEEHLQYHISKRGNEKHLGEEVYFDENMGEKYRLAFFAMVTTANRPNKIVWQMKKFGVRLPAFLLLEMSDSLEGIHLKHELKLGYLGLGQLFDPLIGLYFNKSFRNILEQHCRSEWSRLSIYLNKTTSKP